MTAEIAIINRSAVTLAADSAMTIQVGGARKIYTSADKLFEISTHDPIGVMIYNNLEFMGIPFEVAIKHFRDSLGGRHFSTIGDAADAFFHYLRHELVISEEVQKKHAQMIIAPTFKAIDQRFQREITNAYARRINSRKRMPDFHQLFVNLVQRRISLYQNRPYDECLWDTTIEEIMEFYDDSFSEIIDYYFDNYPLDAEDKALLSGLGALILQRDRYSRLYTGVVFAGFGCNEMFPSLQAFEVDGVVANRLKKKQTESVVMSREEVAAEIIPFAQREMADRFLYGIDPEFEEGFQDFLEDVIKKTGDSIINNIPKASRAIKNRLRQKLQLSIDNTLERFREEMLPETKDQFRKQIEDMVLFMPKPELAHLAEAMVSITSVKRKFSAEEETVAGPIDVAVISKNDGFVWVKRKHYFEAQFNPRFFHRKFGSQKLGG